MSATSLSNTLRSKPPIMTLTPAAALRVRTLMASKGADIVGLKIGIKKGGCAGMEYTMNWVTTIDKRDEVIEVDGAKILIDPQAILYLLGSEMDFKTDTFSSQFVFKNPNQKSQCGCGESVHLEPAFQSCDLKS
ncbi:MAG: Fe-S cluster assembly scaffold SufA [Hyphomicrobium sp.]